jgi:hypothetical protein
VIVATPASIGTESRTLSVERADIEAAGELKFEAKPAGKNVPIEIEGTFLHNARFRMAASAPASISVTTNLPPPEDGKSLSGVVSVAAGTPPGKYEIEIFDINTPEKFLTKKFEVKAP